MTDEQMTDNEILADLRALAEVLDRQMSPRVFAVEQAIARLSQSCATCAHADTRDTVDGWCFCAPPMGDKSYPFYGRSMPLRERCSGWTAKD